MTWIGGVAVVITAPQHPIPKGAAADVVLSGKNYGPLAVTIIQQGLVSRDPSVATVLPINPAALHVPRRSDRFSIRSTPGAATSKVGTATGLAVGATTIESQLMSSDASTSAWIASDTTNLNISVTDARGS